MQSTCTFVQKWKEQWGKSTSWFSLLLSFMNYWNNFCSNHIFFFIIYTWIKWCLKYACDFETKMHASRAGAQNAWLIELCLMPYQQYFRDIHVAHNTWTYLVGGWIFPTVTSPWWHNPSLNLTIFDIIILILCKTTSNILWSLMDTNNPDTSPFRMIFFPM